MPEAHESAFAVLHALDERRDIGYRPDVRQHVEYRLVGAAVQRTVECGRSPQPARSRDPRSSFR